jgi:hypothetical protein
MSLCESVIVASASLLALAFFVIFMFVDFPFLIIFVIKAIEKCFVLEII